MKLFIMFSVAKWKINWILQQVKGNISYLNSQALHHTFSGMPSQQFYGEMYHLSQLCETRSCDRATIKFSPAKSLNAGIERRAILQWNVENSPTARTQLPWLSLAKAVFTCNLTLDEYRIYDQVEKLNLSKKIWVKNLYIIGNVIKVLSLADIM